MTPPSGTSRSALPPVLGGHRPPGRSAWHLPTHAASLSHPDTDIAPRPGCSPLLLPGSPTPSWALGVPPLLLAGCHCSDVSCHQCGDLVGGTGDPLGLPAPRAVPQVGGQEGLSPVPRARAAGGACSHSSPGGLPSVTPNRPHPGFPQSPTRDSPAASAQADPGVGTWAQLSDLISDVQLSLP